MNIILASLLAILVALIVAFLIIMAKAQPGQKRRRAGGGRFAGTGTLDATSRREVAQRWTQVEQLLGVGSPSALRQAVMDSDNLLDLSLRRIGTSGSTMAERLKASGKHFSQVNDIWTAHKLRNQIAHEPGYELHPGEARRAVGYLKQALSELGAFR